MTSIWDFPEQEQERMKSIGIDWSLSSCLNYNPQEFDLTDIESVLAVWQGENDGDDWRWVLKVNKKCADKNGGRYVFLQGGCDYTGWDCQSYAKSTFTKTALQAAKCAQVLKGVTTSDYTQAGLGHMLSLLSGDVGNNANQVYDSLIAQIKSQKNKTWKEKKDEEFNTKNLQKI